MKYSTLFAILGVLIPKPALADDPTPPPGGVCLTADEKKEITAAVEELKKIKESQAIGKFKDPVEIIEDWDGRVYVNGGSTKPLTMNITIGDTIDRDLAVTLQTHVYYRPKPPDPMFRLRIRAQFGALIPEVFMKDKTLYERVDMGIGWDFFHVDIFNVSLYTSIRSLGIGPGLDLTRNFGVFSNLALIYDGFKLGNLTGVYFSFN